MGKHIIGWKFLNENYKRKKVEEEESKQTSKQTIKKKKKKKTSAKLHSVEPEVYSNNKMSDWNYIYTYTAIRKIRSPTK